MIKLFSLKQQKKDGEAGGPQKSTRSAAQLRITKGKIRFENFLSLPGKLQEKFSLIFLVRHQRAEPASHLHNTVSRSKRLAELQDDHLPR
jgi:hypothetical protein